MVLIGTTKGILHTMLQNHPTLGVGLGLIMWCTMNLDPRFTVLGEYLPPPTPPRHTHFINSPMPLFTSGTPSATVRDHDHRAPPGPGHTRPITPMHAKTMFPEETTFVSFIHITSMHWKSNMYFKNNS